MQNRFTAPQLLCMAVLAGKKVLYGIPDVLSGVPDEELNTVIQYGLNELVELNIATMDFSGEMKLRADYIELIEMLTECDACLTVNNQKNTGESGANIFWKKDHRCLKADCMGEAYYISSISEEEIVMFLPKLFADKEYSLLEEAVIPNRVVDKVRCLINDDKKEEALHQLIVNGTDKRMAKLILKGMLYQADYISMLLLDNTGDSTNEVYINRLSDGNCVVEIDSKVINYRTCMVYKSVAGRDVNSRLEENFQRFIRI